MSPLVRLLNALKSVFDLDQQSIRTHIPALMDIKEVGRIIEDDEQVSWMDCDIDDDLPKVLCILTKKRPRYFQIIFEQSVTLPHRNYPLIDGLEPQIDHQTADGACVLYFSRGLKRGMTLRVVTDEVISLFAEELEKN